MSNPLGPSVGGGTFGAIADEVNSSFGRDVYAFWKDAEQLRLGDDWRRRLHEVLGRCDFLVPLVSPWYLQSEVCREEYDAFRSRFPTALERDRRILPILLRPLPEAGIPDEARRFHDELRIFNQRSWKALEDLSPEERNAEFRATAQDIAAQIIALDKAESGQVHIPQGTPPPIDPVDANAVPVADGYYARSSQLPGALLANIGFAGPAHIDTDQGRVVFQVRSALLTTTVENGHIVDANPEFGAEGWRGPVAHVQRLSPNRFRDILRITASAGCLQGEALTGKGEGGFARLFDLEEKEGGATVSGHLSVDVRSVVVVEGAEDESPTARMKARLAEILHEKLGLGDIALEAPEHE